MDSGRCRCQGLLPWRFPAAQILPEMKDGNAARALDWEVGALGSSVGSATGNLGHSGGPL